MNNGPVTVLILNCKVNTVFHFYHLSRNHRVRNGDSVVAI